MHTRLANTGRSAIAAGLQDRLSRNMLMASSSRITLRRCGRPSKEEMP